MPVMFYLMLFCSIYVLTYYPFVGMSLAIISAMNFRPDYNYYPSHDFKSDFAFFGIFVSWLIPRATIAIVLTLFVSTIYGVETVEPTPDTGPEFGEMIIPGE